MIKKAVLSTKVAAYKIVEPETYSAQILCVETLGSKVPRFNSQ